MYTLTLRGTTGQEPDIVAARIRVNGGAPVDVTAVPNATFTTSAQWPTSGDIIVEQSFVDAAGNESARRAQTVTIPDAAAPAIPVADLTLVSVVWA